MSKQTSPFLTRDFMALVGMIFLSYTNLAVFFTFAPYLASLQINASMIGVVIGVFSLSGLVLRPLITPFLFPGNARKWIALAAAVDIGALFLYCAAKTFWPLLLLRLVHGAAYVCMAAGKMALIVAFIPKKKVSMAFSLTSSGMLLPMALMPPLLKHITPVLGGFDRTLVATGLLMILIYPLLVCIRPRDRNGQPHPVVAPIGWKEYMKNLGNPVIAGVLLVTLVMFLGIAGSFHYCAQFGQSIGVGNAGWFFTIAIFTMIAVRLLGGPVLDRIRPEVLGVCSLALLVPAYAGLATLESNVIFYALAPLFGICWGVAHPILHAMLFYVSVPRLQALNQNMGTEMVDGGFFFGPLVGGMLIGSSGFSGFFAICALLSAIALMVFLAVIPPFKRARRQH